MGAHKSLSLGIKGEEKEGVFNSMNLLKAYNLKGEKLSKGRVGIIGGGNSAMDAARISIRQEGVESVTIFYRRSREEMPAINEEIEEALEEGIILKTLITPKRIISTNGHIEGIEFQKNELGKADDSGRRRPLPIENSEYIEAIDTLIVAISEKPDIDNLTGDDIDATKYGTVMVDSDTFATSRKGVFAGGDAVTGPNTVVDAIAAGKKAAIMIEHYLKGKDLKLEPTVNLPEYYIPQLPVEDEEEKTEGVGRCRAYKLPVQNRKGDLEVERTISEEETICEAGRCLRCDLEFTKASVN